MNQQDNNWRQKSLEVLENHYWGDLATAPTNLVKRCMELSKIPVENFNLADLRIMIGQKFGLEYLIPLALEKMHKNIFIEAELHNGDLLESILRIDTLFWNNNCQLWADLNWLLKNKEQQLAEMKIDTTKFYASTFAETKGIS